MCEDGRGVGGSGFGGVQVDLRRMQAHGGDLVANVGFRGGDRWVDSDSSRWASGLERRRTWAEERILKPTVQASPRKWSWAPVDRIGKTSKWEPYLALTCFALCSISLNVANKAVFSAATFHFPFMTIAIQSSMAVGLLLAASVMVRPFGYEVQVRCNSTLLAEMWRPSLFFTLFLVSNAFALRSMSLPMLTIFKSFAPLGITLCEAIYRSERISKPMLFALVLMVLSNAVTISTDIEPTIAGYLFATLSVVTNILQLWSLRFGTSKTWGVTEKAIWGNFFGALFTFPCAVYFGEAAHFRSAFSLLSTPFKMLYFGTGVMGCLISFCMYWATSVSRGSTVSFVGASTKIPLVLIGCLIFGAKITRAGWVGISLGLVAGLVFTGVKHMEKGGAPEGLPRGRSSSEVRERAQSTRTA